MAHRCPKCDEPLERIKWADKAVWICPQLKCNTIYEYLPTQPREVA